MVWARPLSAQKTLRVRCCLRLLAAIASCLPAALHAETVRYRYTFDPSRLMLEHGLAGSIVVVRDGDGNGGAWATTRDAGAPEIPYQTLTFLVPRGARILSVRGLETAPVPFASGLALAAAATWLNDDGRAVAPHGIAKAAGGRYPAAVAELAGGGAWGGYQLASVRVYPVHYDAATRQILATAAMDLELELDRGAALPLARRRFQPDDEVLRGGLRQLVANPEAIDAYDRPLGAWVDGSGHGFQPADAPSVEGSAVDYVIVTSAALAPAWQALADWKTARGVPTVVRTTEWVQAHYRHGSDLQETIRTFLRDAYAQWGIRWVLLGGDTDVIPARFGFSAFGDPTDQSIPTDLYYACLDGNWNRDGDGVFGEAAVDLLNPGDSTDVYAEVFVGRAPVGTAAEAGAFVNKIVQYENPANTNYQQKYLLLGEVLSPVDWAPGQPVSLDGGAFNDELLTFTGACLDTVRLYENFPVFPGATPLTRSGVIDALNAGPGFVNHIGHGFRYNMSCGDASLVNADVLALTNGDRRFVLYMLNCSAAAFDYPCLAEAFLKAQGGAVAVLGASRSAFAIPSRNYNREFFKAIHQNHFAHVGEAFVQSRLAYTPNTYFDTADHYTHLLYNYLGDPEIVAHTCSLATTVANYPAAAALGTAAVTVHVDAGGVPREGARVCMTKGAAAAEAYAWGTTDAAGNVTLAFRPRTTGTAQITVSGQNMTTHTGTLLVGPAPGAFMHLQAVTIHDDNTAPAAGNSDGVLDAGETVAADVTARNEGPATASAVHGVVRVASPHATVTDSTFVLGDLAGAGGTGSALRDVALAVSASAPDQAVLQLQAVFTSATASWTEHTQRVVHAPVLRLVRMGISDPAPGGNGDGVIQAGETVDLVPVFKNYGSGAAEGLAAAIASQDADLTVLQDSIAVGHLGPQEERAPAAHFRITEAALDENPFTLSLRDGFGRTAEWTLTLRAPSKAAKPMLSTKTGANVVSATWTPSAAADLAGYHVYRSASGLGPWARVTTDRTLRTAYYLDTALAPSTQYFYRVTALDESGNESLPSDPASINTSPAQLANWPLQLAAASSCPVAVGDLTGDGSKEIAAGSSRLYAWNWNGTELRDGDSDPQTWGILTKAVGVVTAALSLADLDGVPGDEIFCAAWDDSNKAFVVRRDGSLLPGWPQNPAPLTSSRGYWGATAAVDVDADGVAELFAPGRNGTLYAWHAGGAPLAATAAFKSGFGTNIRSSPAFANLDADTELEIVFASPTGQLNVWNPNGTSLPGFPVEAGGAVLSNPAIGDVNGDGVLDIVLETEGGGGFVHVYNSATATELPGWPRTLTIKGNPVSPSPALADFDGDGKLEIVVANVGGSAPTLSRVQVFDWQGAVVPGWPRAVGNTNSESSPVVADLDGDGVSDVLFGNESGFLYGWNWHGADLPGFPITVGDFVRSTPYVDDVDGDGDVDLVLSGWDKNVYIWDFPAAWHPAAAQWPTLKHDAHRSGTYGFVFDIAPPSLPGALTSPSHVPVMWSNDRTVDVQWNPAVDPSGVAGYSVAWDTSPTTVPDTTADVTSAQAVSPQLADGTAHWFHLRAVDTLGHWTSQALHLGPFWIDGLPPPNSSLAAADRAARTWSNDNTISVSWNAVFEGGAGGGGPGRSLRAQPVFSPRDPAPPAPDAARSSSPPPPPLIAGSSIIGYSIVWDQTAGTVPDVSVETAAVTAASSPRADGTAHWFHLRALDAAGNGSDPQATLHLGPYWIDATPPSEPNSFLTAPALNTWSSEDSIRVYWTGSHDSASGVTAFAWVFDDDPAGIADPVVNPSTIGAHLVPAPEGITWFHVRARDAAGNWSAGATAGPFQIDRQAPVVTLLAPNGGEQWAAASVQGIRWRAHDSGSGVQSVLLRLSRDAGATFPDTIATVAGSDSIYAWTVPAGFTGPARVRVTATDATGAAASDASDNDFGPGDNVGAEAPVTRTWLEAPLPNPFNPSTVMAYSVLERGAVELAVYDVRGHRLRTLVNAVQPGPQWYRVTWDGRTDSGAHTASGTYYVRFRTPHFTATRPVVLLK